MPTLAIIYFLVDEPRRFGELEKLSRINPGTLTTRLKHMHELGIVERHEQVDDNQSVTYSLSKLGNKLVPILDQIEEFSKELPHSA